MPLHILQRPKVAHVCRRRMDGAWAIAHLPSCKRVLYELKTRFIVKCIGARVPPEVARHVARLTLTDDTLLVSATTTTQAIR